MTEKFKLKVVEEVLKRRRNFPSDTKMAAFLGISRSIYSRVFNKMDITNTLNYQSWAAIAKKLDVHRSDDSGFVVAKTPTFNFITAQLEQCQRESIALVMCDDSDIGKTVSALNYVKNNKNAVYIDCSQSKTKMRLLKQIAKEFGLTTSGNYATIYDDLSLYVKSMENPLVILDEAGDLNYEAFLELKALWNATEHYCGWYMMGADGLKAKINRNIEFKKVGYTEIFRRYGKRYQKVSPNGKEDSEKFKKEQFFCVALANNIKREELQRLYTLSQGSLSRLYIEIKKMRNNNAEQM